MGEDGVVVNIDLSTINQKLEEINKSLSVDTKNLIKNCAVTLFTNTNFDVIDRSPVQVAKDCIARALIMAKELQNQGIIE